MHCDNLSGHTQKCGGINKALNDEILTANSMSAYLCDIKKGPLSFKMLPCFFFFFLNFL